MQNQKYNLFKEVFETYKEYDGTIVADHIQKLRELDAYLPPMQSFFIVTNTSKQTYEFVSKNFEHTLGLSAEKMTTEGIKYWFSHFNPENLPVFLSMLEELMNFTMTKVKKKERPRLSYTWNICVKNSNNDYVNIVEHQTPIYFDNQGKPIIGITHCSVIDEKVKKPIIASIKILNDNNEYETLFYKNYSQLLLSASVTSREQDIIRLLSLNNSSKEIAKKLSISIHTVNTHRKNILNKLKLKSSSELVTYFLNNQLY
ncbi:response regulator transcription factor [Polaribacter dokdonensis]|uniref:regulatory protein, LuxR family n=1 Tax=Polaribacter dokdonensis DSW-5 TaxID=1300348 RepID=A0A0M9CH15_9FLAO|nr:LuxR C-terminal-related transcriptional regulator [Polaribacter dokdonensis]KOY51795.1 Regulatory protein, LuxR family [Polaribacter dokdonensis DSW-5]SEE02841.1 regulatory protein, luxR family [Polaribacter dokdonensis DSW-5]